MPRETITKLNKDITKLIANWVSMFYAKSPIFWFEMY